MPILDAHFNDANARRLELVERRFNWLITVAELAELDHLQYEVMRMIQERATRYVALPPEEVEVGGRDRLSE